MHKVTGKEWIWVFGVSVLIMIVFSTPYVIGIARSSPDAVFDGLIFAREDSFSYLAKMRLGAYQGLKFENMYTHEPHESGLVYLYLLGAGRLLAAFSREGARIGYQPLIVAYHVGRILCGIGLLSVLYRFIAIYVVETPRRRLAWILAAVGGGLGWLPLVLSYVGGGDANVNLPVEMYIPEAFTMLSLYGLPHLALARLLLFAGWITLFRAVEVKGWGYVLLTGLAWLGMGLIVPFYSAMLGVLIATWLFGVWVADKHFPWQLTLYAGIATLLQLVIIGYNAWLFSTHPIFTQWAVQNILPSPPVVDYLLAYGVYGILAMPAVSTLLKRRPKQREVLLLTWPLTALLLVYIPVNVQRRLLEGLIVPLVVLATMGLFQLVGQWDDPPTLKQRLRWLGAAVIVIGILPTTVLLVSGGIMTVLGDEHSQYHNADELAALTYLREQAAQGAIVLAAYEQATILPAYAGVKVYAGHSPETVNVGQKIETLAAFYGDQMNDVETASLIAGNQCNLCVVW